MLLFSVSLSTAAILTVKQDGTGNFTGIQQAYLAASSGDTILVYPGTYYENLDITNSSKGITIASLYLTTQDESYIHNTIIDGNQNGSCIALKNTDQAVVTIIGFTVQNGNGFNNFTSGGGIYIEHANPKIRNCIIQNNNTKAGGGIFSKYSTFLLSGTTIRFNHSYLIGGGLYFGYEANAIFDTIDKNNIYLNYSAYGSDVSKTSYCPAMTIILDTFTVINPDQHFIYSFDVYNYPVNDITLKIDNAKVEPIDHDLHVNPVNGSNQNDGLTPETPLKTIAYALHMIASDSLNPLSIFLSNGIYAPSTNDELFPLNGRSYVSIIGENKDSTIFDADSMYYFFKGYGLMENLYIKNICCINGYGNLNSFSGFEIENCNNITLENITITDCSAWGTPGVYCNRSDKVKFSKIDLFNNQGGFNFSIGNHWQPSKTFEINNLLIMNCGPDQSPDSEAEGGGMGISGGYGTFGMLKGKLTNIQITDNLRLPDPKWGPGCIVGLIVDQFAEVTLVNATVGNNIVRGVQGYTINVDEGSELNVYNSIFYGDSLYEMSLGYPSGSIFPATANIAYSNIEGGEDEIMNWYNQHTLNWLDGNMDEDPLWAGTGDTAYYLLPGSPCIDAGTPMYEEGMDYPYIKMENDKIVLYKYDGDTIHLPATDLAGKPRISGGRIDMGAYEYQDTTTSIKRFPNKIQENKVQVYPNPFTQHTFISFRLQNPGKVLVTISDINGRPVKTLMDAKIPSGDCTMIWEGDDNNGKTVGTGTYYVTFYNKGFLLATEKVIKR